MVDAGGLRGYPSDAKITCHRIEKDIVTVAHIWRGELETCKHSEWGYRADRGVVVQKRICRTENQQAFTFHGCSAD